MKPMKNDGWRSSAVLLLVLVCTSQVARVTAKSIIGKVADQTEEAFDDFFSDDQPSAKKPIESLLKRPPLIIGPKAGDQPASLKRVKMQHSGKQDTVSEQTGLQQSNDSELLSSALADGSLMSQISASSARDLKDWPILKDIGNIGSQVVDFLKSLFGSTQPQAAKADPSSPSVQIIFQGIGSEPRVSATGCPGSTCQ